MSHTGLHVFDKTLQESNIWLKSLMERLRTDDRDYAYAALKATLHALRDRIGPENAVHLAAQLPMLLRGMFYEGWRLATGTTRERHMAGFLEHVGQELPKALYNEPEDIVRAVFEVIWERIDSGEVAKLIKILPPELRDLWRGAQR
jgi:uncharacterized protein (DUF2267 family)